MSFKEIAESIESAETVMEAVYLALGAASMCWEPRPSKQVFRSEEADIIGKALLMRLNKMGSLTDDNGRTYFLDH